MAEYHNQSKLRFWCQMVLPLVYDDSLSYMELLNKVVDYLNNCIQDVGNCETNIESLLEAFVNLQDYVNEIVEDLSPEIEAVIDEMIESGELGEILADAISGVIADEYVPTESYVPLNYVFKDGKIYCCTADTTGDWDSTKWRETTIGDELNTLMQRVFALNAGQVSFDESDTYPNDTVGKKLQNLTANDVAYNSSETYNNSTVGKELGNLNSALTYFSNNAVRNKKISIIGDSIETYTGYNPSGYTTYYPNNVITDVEQTWWKQLVNACGGFLEINASYSGSRVTSYSTIPDFFARCNSSILGNPDVIIVALGSNDANNSVALGNYDFNTAYTSLSESTFRTAYIKGVKALKANFPNATIICISETTATAYTESIKRIALALDCLFIDCSSYEHSDALHPTVKGMTDICNLILSPTQTEIVEALENQTVYIQNQNLTITASANDTILTYTDTALQDYVVVEALFTVPYNIRSNIQWDITSGVITLKAKCIGSCAVYLTLAKTNDGLTQHNGFIGKPYATEPLVGNGTVQNVSAGSVYWRTVDRIAIVNGYITVDSNTGYDTIILDNLPVATLASRIFLINNATSDVIAIAINAGKARAFTLSNLANDYNGVTFSIVGVYICES